MLVNPYETRLATFEGTRLLVDTLGVVGLRVYGNVDPHRLWTIQGLYAPLPRRALGGIRARLVDESDFVTFINQRDLEVLLGEGIPGNTCEWMDEPYLAPDHDNWCGLCMDRDDLMDDLLERELVIRGGNPEGRLPIGVEISRKVYMDEGKEVEEFLASLWDMDPETGVSPDTKVTTVDNRWTRTFARKVNGNTR